MNKVWWTQSRPLDHELEISLDAYGYSSFWLPLMRMEGYFSPKAYDLADIDLIYLVSQWAADFYLQDFKGDLSQLEGKTLLAAGQATASHVQRTYGLACLHERRAQTSSQLFQLWQKGGPAFSRILVPLSINSKGKYEALAKRYLPDSQLIEDIIYQTRPNYQDQDELLAALAGMGEDDLIVIASSNSIKALRELAGSRQRLEGKKYISIGQMTSQAIIGLGLEVYAQADEASYESIVEKIKELKVNEI